jgi:hypothetical protein
VTKVAAELARLRADFAWPDDIMQFARRGSGEFGLKSPAGPDVDFSR